MKNYKYKPYKVGDLVNYLFYTMPDEFVVFECMDTDILSAFEKYKLATGNDFSKEKNVVCQSSMEKI